MKGSEFLRKAKKYAKKNRLSYEFIERRGKGSHGTLVINGRFTIVKDRKKELSKDLFESMLRDLGIPPSQF